MDPSSSWSPAWLQFTTLLHWSIDPLGPGQLCSHPGYLGVARPLQLHLLLHLLLHPPTTLHLLLHSTHLEPRAARCGRRG